MKKKWMLSCLSVLLLCSLTFSACGGGSSGASASTTHGMVAPSAAPMEKAEGVLSDSFYSESFVENELYRDSDAKVIRRAYLTIQTTEFETSVAALAELTETHGGYYETARIESGSIYDSRANRSAYYVVRIPKENFVAFRDSVGEVGHLYSIEEGTQDVGENYYDTEARLATLTTKRDRLLSLLEKAEKMEDIISLENALADVQYEIDRHTATLRKYDSLIDFSTFEIHLNEKTAISQQPSATDSFGKRLGAAFTDGMKEFFDGIQDLILLMARNLIGVLIFAVVVIIVVFKARKGLKLRRKKKIRQKNK